MDRQASCAMLLCTASLLIAGRALADGVPVTITNDGTEDIEVTIYDTTVGPRAVVLSQRLNGFSTVPLQLSSDPTGRANLSWTAVTVDPRSRRCGHADSHGLSESASVHVHADGVCAPT